VGRERRRRKKTWRCRSAAPTHDAERCELGFQFGLDSRFNRWPMKYNESEQRQEGHTTSLKRVNFGPGPYEWINHYYDKLIVKVQVEKPGHG
jgi:hypothetical protein